MEFKVSTQCWRCDKKFTIVCNSEDYEAWQSGQLVQDVLAYLSADERELLISGTCGKCWDEMFGESDNE